MLTTSNNDRSATSQVRGVWHRPNSSERETNLEQLCEVLDSFKAAGINMIFLETFYHGKVIFRTDKVPYSQRLRDFTYGDYPDYATAFVTEAEKRGMTVHAWMQDFYVGVEDEAVIVTSHPDWMLINQSGELRHTTEGHGFGGYLFFDPANAEVRRFLVDLYDELLCKIPAIRGLNLDYIRYPISIFEEDTDTGYTPSCMTDFCEKMGIKLEGACIREELHSIIKEKNLVDEWIAHRASYVTSFVKSVKDMLNEKHPDKLVSTAIFPEIDLTYVMKKQNIRAWLDNRYVDMVTPMVYSYEAEQVHKSVEYLKSLCGTTHCYAGLYTTYHNQSTEELEAHIEASHSAGAEGFVLFDAAKTFFEAKVDYMSFLCKKYGN